MRQTENWTSATQESLEHQAIEESSVLDVAQARFTADAKVAGAMSDSHLAGIVSDQLDERNDRILKGDLHGSDPIAGTNEINENNLLNSVIHDMPDFQVDDTLADTARFSEGIAQAFHRVDFDNDSVKTEASQPRRREHLLPNMR